jgi:VCBS repeat-containing protein
MALVANTPPTPLNFTFNIAENATISTNLLAAVTDPDGDLVAMRLIAVGDTLNPTLQANNPYTFGADGSFTYNAGYQDLAPGETRTDTFTYQLFDGLSGSTTYGTLTINVHGVAGSSAPEDDRVAIAGQATTLTGLLDNDNLLFPGIIQSLQAAGPGVEAVTAHGGSIKFAGNYQTDTDLVYTPAPGFVGLDSFTYVGYFEEDGVPLPQSPVTVHVNVVPPLNTPIVHPIGNVDSYDTSPGAVKIVSAANGVLANDDPNGGDLLRANLVSGPAKGVLDFNADGSFQFNPNGEFNTLDHGASETVSFTYAAFNGRGVQTGTTQVNINVTQDGYPAPPLNFAPVVTGETLFLSENQIASINVLANDSDPNGDPLTVVFTGPNSASNPYTVNANGILTYDARFLDIPAGVIHLDTFTYTVSDGLTSTVGHLNVNVLGVSSSYAAADDFRSDLNGQPQVLTGLLNNDTPTSPPSPSSIFFINQLGSAAPGSSATTSAGGTISFQGADHELNTNLIYTPPPGFSGVDTFTYQTALDTEAIIEPQGSATVYIRVMQPPHCAHWRCRYLSRQFRCRAKFHRSGRRVAKRSD